MGPPAQDDLTVSSIVQTYMKKYCFNRNESNLVCNSGKQNGDELSRYDSSHDLHDPKFDFIPAGSKSNPAAAPAGSNSTLQQLPQVWILTLRELLQGWILTLREL